MENMTLLHATQPECMFYKFAALNLEEKLFWLTIIIIITAFFASMN